MEQPETVKNREGKQLVKQDCVVGDSPDCKIMCCGAGV